MSQNAAAARILRATIFHTPRNPFQSGDALESFVDGGLVIQGGKIAACGDYAAVRAAYSDASVTDLRGGFLLPGLVDAHTHFPQIRVLGGLGKQLLEWLEQIALPEEARMSDVNYACTTAQRFMHAMASHGTTAAMVFGAHFPGATAALFQAAEKSGLRIASGLVLSDRGLRPDLLQTPEAAYRESSALIRQFHGRGKLLYAVTPRFAVSTTGAMLEVCQSLVRENPGVRFQTHINENRQEVEEVARLFPETKDYLAVYERFGLVDRRAVLAHNLHAGNAELQRLAASGAVVAHCPSSNAVLGSGYFSMRAHLDAGVPFALGTDVGAGTGFGIFKEALQAHLLQRLAPQGIPLEPSHLLYLATRAGAEALRLDNEIGDFTPGKAADFVYWKAPAGSPLELALEGANELDRVLSAILTLADSTCVREVRVADVVVFRSESS